ncbi:MAG: phosphatidylglycerophosphatase A [Candidatus Brocadiia bacterium]
MAGDERRVKLIGSALGLGYLPVAPGTWASAAAAGVYWLVRLGFGNVASAVAAVLCLLTLALGVGAGTRAEKVYGKEDPGHFVLDELAGQWLTYALFWWGSPALTVVTGFLTFRLLDVLKPFPVRRLEKLPGGWGVMTDDLGAAVYAAVLSWLVGAGLLARFVG